MTRLVKSTILPTAIALGLSSSPPVVTRTGATATRINERALMELCAANSPRFDYDPVTRACRGLLIEEQRANLVLQSQNFGVTWTLNGTPTITAAAYTFGSLSLDLIGDDSGSAVEGYLQNITFTGNAVKAVSIFAKFASAPSSVALLRDTTASANRLYATITWSPAGIPSVAMATGTLLGTDDYGSGLYRFRFQTTSVTAANSHQIQVFPATDAAGSVGLLGATYMGGVQAEDAVFPSSYIPTTTATVTRNSDNISVTTITGWFNTLEGSLVASAMLNTIGLGSDTPALAALDDNTANEELQFYVTRSSGARNFKVVDGGVSQADIGPAGTVANATPFIMAAAYKLNDFALSVDGAAASTDVSGTLPSPTRLRLGSSGAGVNFLNGWLRSLSYYQARLVNADLASLSAASPISAAAAIAWDFTGAALEAQTGALGKPRLAWQTYTRGLTGGSVLASTSDALFPSDAPLRPETYEGWKPTSNGSTWRVDFGASLPIQFFLIVGSGTKVAIEVSQDASVWSWICGALDLDLYPSGATLVLVPTVMGRHARVTMEQLGTMNVFMAGPVLAMERYVTMAFQPINLSRETEKSTSDSRSGQFLGTTIRRMGFKAPVAFQGLSPSWVRANLDPFIQAARLYPYGFAWNPADFPEDVVYGRTADDIAPRYMGDRPLMEASWTIEGFDA
jgi:hypothetical protein